MVHGAFPLKTDPCAAIIGAGRTRFTEHWDEDPKAMIGKAGMMALESVDKGIRRRDIDACYFGSFLYQVTNKIGLVPGYMSRELGINVPMINTEAACASGGLALHNACIGIESGKYDTVLVAGFEKMSDRQEKIVDDLMFAADPHEFESGYNFPGLYATMMTRYIYEYGNGDPRCEEALAQIASKNHHHCIRNKYAQFSSKGEVSVEAVMNSRVVANPIRILHCSPISDGAVALILTRPEVAKKYTDTPIYIMSSQEATDHVSLYTRSNITGVMATRLAVKKALEETGLTIDDIDIAEVHDCFTIEEAFFLEDSGFYRTGEAWGNIYESYESFKGSKHIPYVKSGRELTVNLGGGLKADGHPVGATGIRQAYESFKQLRKEAGENQIDRDVNIAMCHNVGGTGGIATVHILTRDLR
ncbi:MAG: beta-ketoacyl synthase N-terminal-like domain-containing protein [Nitrososphaerales archaeon]